MSSVLILCQNNCPQKNFFNFDAFNNFEKKIIAKNISQAEDYIDAEIFDIISVYSDILDKTLEEFLNNASKNTTSGIILFSSTIKKEQLICLEKKGIFVIDKTVTENAIYSLITLIIANRNRFHKSENDFMTMQSSIEEEKLISRAKCILIQYLNMTESQAHKYIEKQSMNLRQSKSQTAESILKTYEN